MLLGLFILVLFVCSCYIQCNVLLYLIHLVSEMLVIMHLENLVIEQGHIFGSSGGSLHIDICVNIYFHIKVYNVEKSVLLGILLPK